MRVEERLFVGGRWVAPSSDATITVVNPATEEPLARVPEAREADVEAAVAAAREAFDHGPWPHTPPMERAKLLAALSAALGERLDEVARLISTEMGAPYSWSLAGQAYAPRLVLDYYAGLAETFAFEERRDATYGHTLVRREPVGVVAAIVPWNVPLFLSVTKLAPALLAGCTAVLKPAPETPLDSYLLAELLEAAGLPPGVVNIVPADRAVGEHLVTHPGVDKVSFTGSTAAGKRVGALCGERLKRCSLELGGKSAAVLLDDVDLDAAMPGLLAAAMMNNGQACVAQTRVLAPRARYAEVVDALTAAVAALPVGDPLDPATQVGPLVAARQRDRVEGYLAVGRDEGARVTTGGGGPAGLDRGWYVEPTVFADVDNRMRIAREEVFGPVVCVIGYDDVDDAVALANDSTYGLAGSVWTADVERGLDVARRVRTGTATINGFTLEFGAPFGGFKESGVGRELGPEGLEGFCELKSLNVLGG